MDNDKTVYDWQDKRYAFFSHRSCECFPCHQGIQEKDFNCLFCFCPLYCLGDKCGGAFTYDETGIKDCSRCLKPHRRENYGSIVESFDAICRKMAEKE